MSVPPERTNVFVEINKKSVGRRSRLVFLTKKCCFFVAADIYNDRSVRYAFRVGVFPASVRFGCRGGISKVSINW